MKNEVTFGLIADVHYDFMYRANDRLSAFIDHVNKEEVAFIIQLGDFCFPKLINKDFIKIWQRFKGPRYHVLGNHDMDKNDKSSVMKFWGMEQNYYSFDHHDFQFIVLDANYIKSNDQYLDYSHGNYFKYPQKNIGYVSDEQIEWLKAEISASDKKIVIFSHQSLEGIDFGVRNSTVIQKIIKNANKEAGFKKVMACMNGHHHLDGVNMIDDIYYVHINSSSYIWLGTDYNTTSYTEEIRDKYPILKHSVAYRDPLYAIVTINPTEISIQGRESVFIGPSPKECGHSHMIAGHPIVPNISDRILRL